MKKRLTRKLAREHLETAEEGIQLIKSLLTKTKDNIEKNQLLNQLKTHEIIRLEMNAFLLKKTTKVKSNETPENEPGDGVNSESHRRVG